MFILLTFISKANSEIMGIDDLLNPELPYGDDKSEENMPSVQKPKEGGNIEEILGPKDIFPFLPDNHRDSGTGKFNAF